jgi:hypothetical protein
MTPADDDKNESRPRVWEPSELNVLIAVRFITLFILAAMTYFSTTVNQELAELALSALTAGGLLVTPQILSSVIGPETIRRNNIWVRAVRRGLLLLVALGFASIGLIVYGFLQGSLTQGEGRLTYLLGVALLTVVVLFGLLPAWAIKSVRDGAESVGKKEREKLRCIAKRIEDEGWPLLFGAILIAVGTALQFLANTEA